MIQRVEEAEVDEMWSYVGKKREPRWLWHAIDHRSGHVLAYVLGRRKDEVFLKLKALLEPFGITQYYTDYWGAYTRHLDADAHQPGKRNTQQIERKHLTLRTRIKRLVRKTICWPRSWRRPPGIHPDQKRRDSEFYAQAGGLRCIIKVTYYLRPC